jgi:hypothetical protein
LVQPEGVGSLWARRSVSQLVLGAAQIIGLLDWDHNAYCHRLLLRQLTSRR